MTKHLKEVDRLQKIVEAFPKVTITVLGDLVADEFVYGEISRVSREAPVLILKHRERTVVPGGGANAVNNLADLGVNVLPVGAIGDDEPGRLLLKFFRHKRIPVSGVLKDKSYTTVTKTRILAGMTHNSRQQVVRVDREPENPPNQHLTRELFSGGAGIFARFGCAAGFRLRLWIGESGDRECAAAERAAKSCAGAFDPRFALPAAGVFGRDGGYSERA